MYFDEAPRRERKIQPMIYVMGISASIDNEKPREGRKILRLEISFAPRGASNF
jgi:hypothetical protein